MAQPVPRGAYTTEYPMPQPVVIENPILNSPFEEPTAHFKFDDYGITSEIEGTRRVSSYFIPIAKPRMAGQLTFDTEWTQDRVKENDNINRIRERVGIWRTGKYEGTTSTTRQLLKYWRNPERERRLFFAQIEAIETIIYLTEVAGRYGDNWIENYLRRENAAANSGLYRMASKMATGSGKTVVMGMLIAWQTLNKQAAPQDSRFTDAFLIVTPGITIRDRLRVLLPSDPNNYYRRMDLVPPELMEGMGRAKMVLTNFHAFQLREKVAAGRLTKAILAGGDPAAPSPFTETPDQMVRRVLRELGNKRSIIVLNDEAHHCYQRKPDGYDAGGSAEAPIVAATKLAGEEREEAEQREKDARVWLSGLLAIKKKIGVKAVYDLSATPFYLRGSGYAEGTLFPWVVSDFSLIDAIESGIVKVPRVPVSDDAMHGTMPTYRNLWAHVGPSLPKKGRAKGTQSESPNLPAELEGALHSLYGNYAQYYKLWEQNTAARDNGQTPPVFIVVASNTLVSKMIYDYIAGYETTLADDTRAWRHGELSLFSNVQDGKPLSRPNTILIDSQQLESGEGMNDEFKKAASLEIEEFKAEYRQRFPGRSGDDLTDEDILREVMNTVGKQGKLGENVKCVVSVSMLSEGWDANTVTHILGVRAFSTQLLCEQVVGRGLRRTSYAPNSAGKFDPEYAEVYGVPFSFIPSAGSQPIPKVGPSPTRVRAVPDRVQLEITMPRLVGYRYDLPAERAKAEFTKDSYMTLTPADVPTATHMMPIVGETAIHTLGDLHSRREQEVAFLLAKYLLENHYTDAQNTPKPWLYPQLVQIAKDWMRGCVTYKGDTFPQLFLIRELGREAAKRIYAAIVTAYEGERVLKPMLRPHDTLSSTRDVDFDTTKPTYLTKPDKSHISHVVADSMWEEHVAIALEDSEEVVSYVKNYNLGFTIPYTYEGEPHQYVPDFVVRARPRNGAPDDIRNIIIEVSGEPHKEKASKVAAARQLWVPAVNNFGAYGRWDFIEVTDLYEAKNQLRAELERAVYAHA